MTISNEPPTHEKSALKDEIEHDLNKLEEHLRQSCFQLDEIRETMCDSSKHHSEVEREERKITLDNFSEKRDQLETLLSDFDDFLMNAEYHTESEARELTDQMLEDQFPRTEFDINMKLGITTLWIFNNYLQDHELAINLG